MGPSSFGSGRRSRGQATLLCKGSRWAAAFRHLPCAVIPYPRGRRSPRGDRGGYQLNLNWLLQKWKRSQKRQWERISLQTDKCKQKEKEKQRENRQKWPTKRLKKTYLQKMERLKMRRAQPLMKQKPSLTNTTHPVLSVVPVSLLVQSRAIFLSTIL